MLLNRHHLARLQAHFALVLLGALGGLQSASITPRSAGERHGWQKEEQRFASLVRCNQTGGVGWQRAKADC